MLLRPVAMLQRQLPANLVTVYAYVQFDFDKQSLHACTSTLQQPLNLVVHKWACGTLLVAVKFHRASLQLSV